MLNFISTFAADFLSRYDDGVGKDGFKKMDKLFDIQS